VKSPAQMASPLHCTWYGGARDPYVRIREDYSVVGRVLHIRRVVILKPAVKPASVTIDFRAEPAPRCAP
jgi:hypothetical protein